MTPAQKLRLIGFNASLKQRGVSLVPTGSGSPIMALVDDVPADSGDHSMSDETRDMAWVAVTRASIAALSITVGDTLKNLETGASYRIVQAMSRPQDFVVRFKCEASFP